MILSYLLAGLSAFLLALSIWIGLHFRNRMTYRLLTRGFFLSIASYVVAGFSLLAYLDFVVHGKLPYAYVIPVMVLATVVQLGYILANNQIQGEHPDQPTRLRLQLA
jgi:uncharacterized membrane protein YhhN